MTTLETIDAKSFEEVIKRDGINIVEFWAPWCGPCRILMKNIENSNIGDTARVYKVNVDDNEELAANLSIRSVPYLKVYKDGRFEHSHHGQISMQILQDTINSMK